MSETQLRLTLINCAYKPIQTGLGTSRNTVLLGSAFLSQTSAQTDKHRSGGRKDFLVSIHEQVEQQPRGSTLPAASGRREQERTRCLPSTKSGRLLLAAELDHSLPLTLLWKPQPPAGNGSFNFSNHQARLSASSSVNTLIPVTWGVTNVVAENLPQSILSASPFIWLQLKH